MSFRLQGSHLVGFSGKFFSYVNFTGMYGS